MSSYCTKNNLKRLYLFKKSQVQIFLIFTIFTCIIIILTRRRTTQLTYETTVFMTRRNIDENVSWMYIKIKRLDDQEFYFSV